tara:strand:+ start:630 stop:830 length:201 start_codon:yes stop_codon:yes gene_type:complete
MKNKILAAIILIPIIFLVYIANFIYKLETGKLPPEVASEYIITIPTDCTNSQFEKNLSKKKEEKIM